MLNENVSIFFSIFIITSTICFAVLTFFISKLANSAKNLVDNANIITLSVQKEIEPTLKELKEAAKSINSIALSADTNFKNTKAGVATLIGTAACLGGKLKTFSQGIMKGLSFGMGLFKK